MKRSLILYKRNVQILVHVSETLQERTMIYKPKIDSARLIVPEGDLLGKIRPIKMAKAMEIIFRKCQYHSPSKLQKNFIAIPTTLAALSRDYYHRDSIQEIHTFRSISKISPRVFVTFHAEKEFLLSFSIHPYYYVVDIYGSCKHP